MSHAYMYVVDRDFGFAPNPFHGFCSLATCKPVIRKCAQIGDWVVGVGGKKLNATGRLIFAMKVTRKVTFNEYWEGSAFRDKKPVRNGSKKMMLGDNIYYYDDGNRVWLQAHSHHSNVDGTMNEYNMERDTHSNYVLIADEFFYFGSGAPVIPPEIMTTIGYRNGIGHRKFEFDEVSDLLKWIEGNYQECKNLVLADPFNFDNSAAHYSVETNRVTQK